MRELVWLAVAAAVAVEGIGDDVEDGQATDDCGRSPDAVTVLGQSGGLLSGGLSDGSGKHAGIGWGSYVGRVD